MKNYVPIDVQSSYSIGKSICTIKRLVRKARKMGLPAIALTDDGFMFGAKEFYDECRRQSGTYGELPPIKPILGLSIHVFADGTPRRILLLAKNEAGYRNLARIASTGAKFEKPDEHSVDFQTVEKWHGNLICLTEETDAGFVERCMEVFGEDFAFEATGDDCDFSAWPSAMVCAANHVRMVDVDDAEAFEVNRAIRAGVKLKDLVPSPEHDAPRHLLASGEMAALFPSHPEWIANTARLAERIEAYPLDAKQDVYPFPIPDGFTGKNEYLRHLAFEGAKRRWGDPLPRNVVERLDYELGTLASIDGHGLDASSYFLIVRDYVEAARRMGVAVGPGRGGAGGSALAYALGITDVDPLECGLLFERFVNHDRLALPDFDIDFDEDGREKVFNHIVEKYGRDHVASIASFGVAAPRTAVRAVALALGFPRGKAEALAGKVPLCLWRPTFEMALSESAELRRTYEKGSGMESRVLHVAEKLCGCVRHVGTHACGFVISARKIADTLPVIEYGGLPVTQYDGRYVEDIGLVKFDILGLKALSEQKRCIDLVKARTGEAIDISRIPDGDKKALDVFARGDTGGIFQFDYEGIRDILRQLKPTRFSDIVAVNALFRPGVMEHLPQFIRRKNGEEPVVCDHPLMDDILAETYGMAIYQEQVMQLAQRLAGFTRGESDTLRKALGKKKQQLIEEFRVKFISGCLANPSFRVGKWQDESAARVLAEKLFRDWEEFSLYAFNKSHAACYALLAYRSAYLKAHWPEEFAEAFELRLA